jgi:hypothetical protein
MLTSVTIGAGVTIGTSAFFGNLADVYAQGDRQKGTYTRPFDSTTWTKPQ